MADNSHWLDPTFAKRLGAWRRHRGFRTAASLAERIEEQGGSVSASVIQNLESGRKVDPTVSQLIALSRALGVPPIVLLIPLGDPMAPVEMAGAGFEETAAFELDAWWSGLSEGIAEASLPQFPKDDWETLRALRGAVQAMFDYQRWHLRHAAAVQAGDEAGTVSAHEATSRALVRLIAASSTLHVQGLPTGWIDPLVREAVGDAEAEDADR